MSESENARVLLAMARKDLTALGGMLDTCVFAEEVFGFHAQQAVEKALKAWIASCGQEYPLIHDLGELLSLPEKVGLSVKQFWNPTKYTVFAVQFRYEYFDAGLPPLDRAVVLDEVKALVEHVGKLV